MDLLDFKFWAGSEDSLHAYLSAVKKMGEAGVTQPEKVAYAGGQNQPDVPRLLSRQGDVAVISISGPLNNTDSWRNEYVGAVGYPEIRAALVHAASDAGVKTIVLDIKSGGGAVSGVTDTADLIAMIDTKVKPVHAYSDGMIASAAYWLGSSARSVDIGKVTEAGSVGILTVHQDLSKMFAEMGVTMTVLRAGKYKAMGNSYEPLSDSAKAEIQGQLDQMYQLFAQHVADSRGVTYAVADQQMAQGRVFVGQAAVTAGLVDSVTTFDAFMSKISAGIDAQKNSPKYGSKLLQGTQVKTALTDQQVAALAAGGGLTAVAAASAEAVVVPTAPAAPAAAAAPVAASPEATATLASATLDQNIATLQAQITLLTSQAATAQGQLVDAQVALRAAEASAAPLKASIDKMRPVVQKSVSNLRVALGHSAAGVEALGDDSLLAEQASLAAQFTDKFKVGGVAGVAPVSPADKKAIAPEQNALHMARIAATRTK